MKKAVRRTLAAVLAVFLLAGCGPQAQDEDNVQIIEDEKEQVYIFPDGTIARGGDAEWMKEAVARLYPTENFRSVSAEEAQHILGTTIVLPDLPGRFHLVGFASGGSNEAASVKTYWAAPESKEWLEVAIRRTDTNMKHFETPWCDEGTEVEGKKISDVFPWARQRCTSTIEIPGWYVHLWMLNVPGDDARHIATSIYDKLLALAE